MSLPPMPTKTPVLIGTTIGKIWRDWLQAVVDLVAAMAASSPTWGGIVGTLSNQTDLSLALSGKVPTSRTVNSKALTSNIVLTPSDVGAQAADADLTALAALTATGGWAKRTATDTWAIAAPTATEITPVAPRLVTAATTTETTTDTVLVGNRATAVTVTLLAATGSGRVRTVSNINTGAVTVTAAGTDTIDGQATQTVLQYESLDLVDVATGKWVVA